MPGPARQLHTQQVHYLRKRVRYNDSGIATGVNFGTLPAGSQLIGIHARITTAFNAATTNNLLIGTTAGGNDIMVTGESLAGATGFKSGATGQAVTFANDTDLYVAYTQTGGAATAGDGYVVLTYVPNNDQ
jgi:hypothetical protein